MTNNIVTELFNIQHPIIQGGMVWNSGWRLASAVSNCGGLGLIGSGSMYPETLREHIQKCKMATQKPFGVNVPLLYPDIDKHMEIILEENIPIVFTSAGNPKIWTPKLKKEGRIVVHVVPGLKYAHKAQQAGVDAIVAEGFEAGGHNGREETTTLALVPNVRRHIQLPLIAAGGIATGEQILAAFALGADAVQLGSRFATTFESSSHDAFKEAVVKAAEGDTRLTLKELAPVRLIKNEFYAQIEAAYANGATVDELRGLLGRGRAKKGMFEGNLAQGELEIGQSSSLIDEVKPVKAVFEDLIHEYRAAVERVKGMEL